MYCPVCDQFNCADGGCDSCGPFPTDAAVVIREDFKPDPQAAKETIESTRKLLAKLENNGTDRLKLAAVRGILYEIRFLIEDKSWKDLEELVPDIYRILEETSDR